MTEITDHDQHPSPSVHDDALGGGNGNGILNQGGEPRGIKRSRPSNPAEDDDDDDDKPGRERRKIEIKFIQDKSRRHITFSKRKAGIMKKAYELSVLTGTQVLLLVVSETGLVYTFTTPKLQPLVTKPEGKNLIQACLNAPEPNAGNENGVDTESAIPDSPEEPSHQQIPQHANLPRSAGLNPGYMAAQQQQAQQQQQQAQQAQADIAYQHYIQQQASRGMIAPQPGMTQHPQV